MKNDPLDLFRRKPRILNIGLEHFYHELKKQGAEVAHVEWKPKPKLEEDLENILEKIM